VAYVATQPSIEEARLLAIQALIVGNLGTLNTALTYDGLWPSSVAITSGMVTLGDAVSALDLRAAPVLICVLAGDAASAYIDIDRTDTRGLENTFWTAIVVYVHPDAIGATSSAPAALLAQAAMRETLRVRICDWLRAGVFNLDVNSTIQLASQEYTSGASYDVLDRCIAVNVKKDLVERGFGSGETVYGTVITHQGRVR
jgi:hypothetical protein